MIQSDKINAFTNSEERVVICKDHLVSNEDFEIVKFKDGILKTYPVPYNLSSYYESQDYISHNDSSRGLQNKIYQIVKSHMLSKKANWIKKYFSNGTILDYGAGTGDFLNTMKKLLWNVEGVEPNKTARSLGVLKGLNLKSDISKLENSNYDVISLWHVLEHIPDFDTKISKFYELLQENGLLVIAVPNYKSYDSEYYKSDWAAWDVPRHLWHFSRSGIKSVMENLGFELMEEKPLKFDSYYVSLLSERNKENGGNVLNAFYRGYISNLRAKSSGEYSSVVYFFKKTLKT
ncbi:class I SAM-dependent methyltransferase [Christiangramia sp. SM2212]|uniref:Class I SAM-dependent methyltransferase n=1 Tax=Christiangramia sediminicola TaxID=3073267 RepID=A0ABU1ETR8_9FLAO|nr:class I SAM-dependent methyltransferase [Christiangramia sp. SM2212]MDR5591369.1 class I SAM-dependent methyltransferase [Christiangramia sp. SM2212]